MSTTPETQHAQVSLQTHWFGNATTALQVALQALGCRDRYVAVTPNVCPNVIAAILATANRPYFVDIEQERLGMDPASLESVIGDVGAVIAVHAYGIPCFIDRICAIGSRHGIPVIEDCAQAEGAVYLGQPVGSSGDIAVYSYGAGKIIDAGGGGSATTTSMQLSERIAAARAKLPRAADANAGKELSLFFKFFYNNLYPHRLTNYRAPFSGLLRDFGTRLLSAGDPGMGREIDVRRAALPDNLASRKTKADIYRRLLPVDSGIKPIDPPGGSVYWRYNVLADTRKRDAVLRSMLDQRLNISSWYPDISAFLDPGIYRSEPLPTGNWLADRILNLWVSEDTTENQVGDTCRTLAKLLH